MLSSLLRRALELGRQLRGVRVTRTAIATFAAVCYSLARLLLEAWWELTEVGL